MITNLSGTQISTEKCEMVSVSPLWKTKRVANKKYIEWIRSLPCLVCQRTAPSDPHHIVPEGHGGKGVKVDDTRCIPLCHEHHNEYHNQGRQTFAKKYNADYEDIIARLNNVWHHMTLMDKK